MEKSTKTLSRNNGVLDDIAAEIGFTATCTLVDWFGGKWLHIPSEANEGHAIANAIGLPAMRRLVALYEGLVSTDRLLWIPLGYWRDTARRDRMIALMFQHGWGTQQIASITGLRERRLQQLRSQVEKAGLLPLILHSPSENPEGETADEIA